MNPSVNRRCTQATEKQLMRVEPCLIQYRRSVFKVARDRCIPQAYEYAALQLTYAYRRRCRRKYLDAPLSERRYVYTLTQAGYSSSHEVSEQTKRKKNMRSVNVLLTSLLLQGDTMFCIGQRCLGLVQVKRGLQVYVQYLVQGYQPTAWFGPGSWESSWKNICRCSNRQNESGARQLQPTDCTLQAHKYVCITTYQPDSKSNS